MTNRGNGADGIFISAPGNLIGGLDPPQRNLISGNSDGIELTSTNAAFNQILGNFIGTDITGSLALPNNNHGIQFTSNARSNTVGTISGSGGNRIAFNTGDGLYVNAGTNNTLRGNSIFANAGLGIDLGVNGVTGNDPGDADTGANNLQNFPILATATNQSGGVAIAGTLNTRPSTMYQIDFYSSVLRDPTLNGEGEYYLGSTNVTTDGAGNVSFDVLLPGTLFGRYVSATATDPAGNTSEFSPVINAQTTVAPISLTVVNTNDRGPGSLRQAIVDANGHFGTGPDTIGFNIPGAGPHTILPLSLLPAMVEPAIIDGFLQPGASANTLPGGNNGIWRIELNGSSIGTSTGLVVDVSGTTIRGLSIVRFTGPGIALTANATNAVIEGNLLGVASDNSGQPNNTHGVLINGGGNLIGGAAPSARNVISANNQHGISITGGAAVNNRIQGNFIGTDISGTLDFGNASDGINLNGVSFNQIGGGAAGEGNLISGNNNDGVEIANAASSSNVIRGNLIGTAADGTTALGNNFQGISLNARFTTIGGIISGQRNIIAFNGGDGMTISGTNNQIRGNSIFSNGEFGIDLANNGITPNDDLDTDTGANQFQNFPIITSATANVGNTIISGTLNSRSNLTYDIDFFANLVADPAGNGEGQQFLGSTTVTTDTAGNGTFNVMLSAEAIGRYISATATDPGGNTSEFSTNFTAASTLPPITLTVVNTNDSGPGSLRQALLDAGTRPSDIPHQIVFSIPGAGPHTIAPLSQMPTPVEPVFIDGYSQPGSVTNSAPNGFNGTIKIRFDGGSVGGFIFAGLRLQRGNSVVRGIAFTRWNAEAIELSLGGSNRVSGCLFGIDVDGTDRHCSTAMEITSDGNETGGLSPADRNVFAYNFGHAIFIGGNSATNNTVRGNFIGTDFSGTVARPNINGIQIQDAGNNLIGGTQPGARNLISGNSSRGISITTFSPGGAPGNIIQGNLIGTDITGTLDLGNFFDGIELGNTARTIIGGSAPGAGNIIGGNNSEGVDLGNGTSSIVQGNWIGVSPAGSAISNSSAGIIIGGSSNLIGGTGAGEGNVIAYNRMTGIYVSSGTNNQIRGNTIFANDWGGGFQAGLGIDLNGDAVTPNDSGDADGGPNNRQNFPVLTSATGDATSITIQGSINSIANQTYQLDFFANLACDAGGNGEGQFYLGNGSVNIDGSGTGTFNITLPATPNGRFITATATDPFGNTSEFSLCFEGTLGNPPATFTVTNTNDSGPGSLRQAILDSNNHVSSSNNIVAFNIPASGIQTIRPLAALPAFIQPVTIDGFTQPGASANTLSASNNAVWLIELDGSLAGNNQDGLRLNIPRLEVRGLRINRFSDHGVSIVASNSVLSGNFIYSNFFGGIEITSHGNRIGGTNVADRNIISGHGGSRGIEVGNANRNQILGNWIGPAPDRSNAMGSQFDGVNLFGSSDNQIGDGTAAGGNLIAYNGGGVFIQSGTNNSVRGNQLHSNNLGIDLGLGGTLPNDPGDTDTGANQFQNYPILTNIIANAGNTVIQGTLNSLPNISYTLDFYANTSCDFSGYGEAEFYLGSGNVTTDGGGNAVFGITLPVTIPALNLTATATDPFGNTSELSACRRPGTITIPPATYTVTTTNDSGPGSLRQALLDASARITGTNHLIHFNMGASGVQTILLNSTLPTPAQPVTIDGFTQPGAQPSSASATDNAVRLIRVSGLNAGPFTSMIDFTTPGNIMRGLDIQDFNSSGILLTSDRNILEGNFIHQNRGDGISFLDSDGNTIGGNGPAQRNIISGNNGVGIDISGNSSSNRLVGNFIGMSPTGGNLSNRLGGVVVIDGRNNIIGEPGLGNAIAFNAFPGIQVGRGTNNSIRGNSIFANNGIGIDLASPGVTLNDAGDADNGANLQQNYPILTSAAGTNSSTLVVQGNLNSAPNRSYQIDFYFNSSCDTTGNGEGQTYLGSTSVNTDGAGNGPFTSALAFNTLPGFVTATATDANGNTSEFSPCQATSTTIPPMSLTVVNTNDSGAGSLREAILTANQLFTTGTNSIVFNIPGNGEQIIGPSTSLPAITQPVLVDGYTQTGAILNNSATSHTAVVLIRLDGAASPAGANGLVLGGSNAVIRGLAITRFSGAGILITGNNNVVDGNLIGVVQGSARNPSLSSPHPSAPGSTGNGSGVIAQGRGNRIGGSVLSARNVISANDADGVLLTGVSSAANVVLGNWIGSAVDAIGRKGNARHGVAMADSASGNTVGPDNLLSYNAGAGIAVLSGSQNVFPGNDFEWNGGIPIDLGGDGPTRNDIADLDLGPNGLKNYPVITVLQNLGNNQMYIKGYFPQFNTPGLRPRRADTSFAEVIHIYRANDLAVFAHVFAGTFPVENNGTFEGTTTTGSIPAGTKVRATATGNGNTSEMSPALTVTPPPNAMADLVVTHVVTPSTGLTGSLYTITMTVSNAGPATAENVFAGLIPPVTAEFISSSSSVGTPSFFIGVGVTVDSLPMGGSFTLTAQVRAMHSGEDIFLSEARSFTPDPNPDNNRVVGSIKSYIRVDNRVSIVARPSETSGTVQTGQTVSIGYNLKNLGPDSTIGLQGIIYLPYKSVVTGTSGQGATFTLGTMNERFIAGLYKDILCREADDFDLSKWAGQLETGTLTRRQVADSFLNSPEGRQRQVTDFYQTYLHRPQSDLEMSQNFARIIAGDEDPVFQEDVLGSDEYFQKKGGSINTYVNDTYQILLGRQPTTTESDTWRGQIWSGLGREMYVGQLLQTPEARNVTVGNMYDRYLRRNATPAETSAGASRLQSGEDNQAVIADIVASPEYFQNSGHLLKVKYSGTMATGGQQDFTVQQRFSILGRQNVHFSFIPDGLDADYGDNSGDISLTVVGFSPVDYGDAPDSYKTLSISGGPSHPIVLGLRLGGSLDPDLDGQPGFNATGDDLDEGDDDDGIAFRGPLVPGVRTAIEVTSAGIGNLDFWIDFNRNGAFEHRPPTGPNEYVNDRIIGHTGGSYFLLPGLNVIEFFTPSNNVLTGITYARFRFSSLGGLSPVGPAQDGEVEDYQVAIYSVYPDFGDAPDSDAIPGYPTLLSHNGAYHLRTIEDFYLGTRIDHEGNGQPDDLAQGDDKGNGVDFPETTATDEDGVSFPTDILPGQSATIQVIATIQGVPGGKIDGWIDWNQDGFWTPDEKILNNLNLIHGTNLFQVMIPQTARIGLTYGRFRMSQSGNLQPFGPVDTGEVEDYAVFVGRRNFTQTVREGSNLRLEWAPGAVLQRALVLPGPWEDVPGAFSPFIARPSDGTAFYRLRLR